MYLFFVRHFNDIDHIVPVVWRMKQDQYPAAVYCMNPRYEIETDYRLQFLKKIGVPVDHLHHAFDQRRGRLHGLLQDLMNRCFAWQKKGTSGKRQTVGPAHHLPAKAAGLMDVLFYKLTRLIYYNTGWARSVLQSTGAAVICFDHIRPGLYVVKPLLKYYEQFIVGCTVSKD